MFDITLIENIYIFLQNLEKDSFICKDIKLKIVSKQRNRIYFKSYINLQSLYEQHKSILDNKKPNRYCTVGDYPFIENIQFINNNTNYYSQYNYYHITSSEPFVKDITKYDNSRNNFYNFDKVKYIEYTKQQLIEHNDRNIELADLRLSSYVDACYVDPNYVEKDETSILKSIREDLK